ncbi:MAG: peptidyl-prolyl cis-trans isomerase [Acidobacteria bacterium]|nr:peptidyl-prolyl cis-trans isomerase [Acidobacteriota bacterium]
MRRWFFLFVSLVFLLSLFCSPLSAYPLKGKGNPVVVMKTNMGNITIKLFRDKAPITVDNFLKYVKSGFYNGLIFHRVIPGFVIQGGGYTPDMLPRKTRPAIKNEATNGLSNLRGTIAMARTQVIDSATSQFFINLKDNKFLDHRGKTPDKYGYAVFGKVIKGMDVVDRIAKVPTGRKGPFSDVPKKPVIIKSVVIIKE